MMKKSIIKTITAYLQLDIDSISGIENQLKVLEETVSYIKDNVLINYSLSQEATSLIYTYEHPEILLTNLADHEKPTKNEIQAVIRYVLDKEQNCRKKSPATYQKQPKPPLQNEYFQFKLDKLEGEALASLNFYFRPSYEFYKSRQNIALYLSSQNFTEYKVADQDYAKLEAVASRKYPNKNVLTLYLTPYLQLEHQFYITKLLVGIKNHQIEEIKNQLNKRNKTYKFELPNPKLDTVAKVEHILVEAEKKKNEGLKKLDYLYDYAINELQMAFINGWSLKEIILANKVITVASAGNINCAYLYNTLGHHYKNQQNYLEAARYLRLSIEASSAADPYANEEVFRGGPVTFKVGDTHNQRKLKLNINNYETLIDCMRNQNSELLNPEINKCEQQLPSLKSELANIMGRDVYETSSTDSLIYDTNVHSLIESAYFECKSEAGTYAAGREDWATVFWLLDEKLIDINFVDAGEYALLHYAASSASRNICEQLVARGAKIDLRSPLRGYTPLQISVANPDMSTLEFFCSNCEFINFNNQDADGDTPLHQALLLDNPSLSKIKLLLACKADATLPNKKGQVPLMLVLEKNLYAIANYFFEKGIYVGLGFYLGQWTKNPSLQREQKNIFDWAVDNNIEIDFRDNEGNTLLHHLLSLPYSNERWNLIGKLLRKSVFLLEKNNSGSMPITVAMQAKWPKSAFEKLLTVIQSDLENQPLLFKTLFFKALRENDAPIIELFLELGADITLCDAEGNTPLHAFMDNERLRYSFEVEKMRPIGQQLICLYQKKITSDLIELVDYAIVKKKPSFVIEILLKYTVPTEDKLNNWLHHAALNWNRDLMKLLIANGSDIDSRDKADNGILHKLIVTRDDNYRLKLTQFLPVIISEFKPNLKLTNANGKTAYDLAEDKSLKKILKVEKPWQAHLIKEFSFTRNQITNVKNGLGKSLEITTPGEQDAKEVYSAIRNKIDPKNQLGGVIRVDYINKKVEVSFKAKKTLKSLLFGTKLVPITSAVQENNETASTKFINNLP
jgi:ankyrin repeat protein